MCQKSLRAGELKQPAAQSSLGRLEAQVLPGCSSSHASAARAGNHARANQVGLTDLLHSGRLLTYCNGQGVHADWTSPMAFNERLKHRTVQAVEPALIHIEDLQSTLRCGQIDVAITVNLGVVPHTAQ